MKKYIVVGAGILGASTAYHLAKAGADVVVIDRGDKGQATDAAAGIVCPWISQRRNQAWYTLAKNGAHFYTHLIPELEEEGESNTGYAQVGAISIRTDDKKLLDMEKRALKRRETAPEMGEIKILSSQETQGLFPPLANNFRSVYISGAARVEGRTLRDALLRSARRHGATIVNGDAHLVWTQKKITGIKADEEYYEGDTVIVTNGAWASKLLKPLGIHFQVNFQKGQIIHLQLPQIDTSNWPVVMPQGNHYIVPFQHGRIVAGTTHENNTGYDLRVTAGGMQEIFGKLLEIAPGIAESTFLEARVGFRPFTPGFLPVIGPIPGYKGLLAANGLGSSGLTTGPYLGAQLAKLALGERMDIDIHQYNISHAIGTS